MIDRKKLSNEIREIIIKHAQTWFYVYKENEKIPSGVYLIKDKSNDKKYYFKPTQKRGRADINKHLNNKIEHWGKPIDYYIFIGCNFRVNAKAYTRHNKNLIILDIIDKNKEIIIYGSENIDQTIIECFKKLEYIYDYKVLTDMMKSFNEK